jgi:hypothetical protein
MSASSLPSAVEKLVRAIRAGTPEHAIAAFHPDASFLLDGKAYEIGPVQRWTKDRLAGRPAELRILHTERRGPDFLVAVQVHWSAMDIEGPFLCLVRCADEAILRLDMMLAPVCDLPAAVWRFVRAVNRRDLAALLDVFTEDALVNDELVEYFGMERIADWAQRAVINRKLALYVVAHDTRDERVVVTSHATGEFDMQGLPDPLVLSLYFSLHDERVAQLIILQNQPSE